MAVWLSLNIKDNGPIAGTNSSSATVTLTVHYSGGSYNGFNPSGTLTIDGEDYPFTCNFNYAGIGQGNIGQSGSVVACTETVTVPHGSDGTKTLYCSASFDSGTDSGTVTTSASKTLSATSGGDSGGGDSGDSGEEPDTDRYRFRFKCTVGEHAKIILKSNTGRYHEIVKTGTMDTWLSDANPNNHYFIYAEVTDDNYEIDTFTNNGEQVPDVGYFTANRSKESDLQLAVNNIVVTTRLKNAVPIGIPIDNGTTIDDYCAYIDDGTTIDDYCAYIDDGVSWHPYS